MSDDLQLQRLAQKLYPYLATSFLSLKSGYDAGTWIPTYLGVVPGVTTYTTQQGDWWRLGPIVIATATIVWTAATGTGNARFSLPFTASATANRNWSGSVRTVNMTFANGAPQVQLAAGLSYITLESPLTNAASTTVQMEAAGNVIYTVVYAIDP